MASNPQTNHTGVHVTTLVLSDNPQLDDALIVRLQYDLATRIHTADTIAQRYGLGDKTTLWLYLRQHPQVVIAAQRARALMDSDQSIETRIRLKAMHATEDLIETAHELADDPRTPMQQRLDAFKQLSRVAGVDGMPAAAKGAEGPTGQKFVLNILFSGGETTNLSGVVIDNDAVAPPRVGYAPGEPVPTAPDEDGENSEYDVDI